MSKKTVTYSMMSMFSECPRKCYYRYMCNLKPKESPLPLEYGSLMHTCLEKFYWELTSNSSKDEVHEELDRIVELSNNLELEDKIKLKATLHAYIDKYYISDKENFQIVNIEEVFKMRVVNPVTRRHNRTWELQGKVDGIVRIEGKLHLLEHKTTANISTAYIDRLGMDLQIALYSHAISQKYNEKIEGIVYNIISKPSIKMKQGETDEEWEIRRNELISKSKTGKTTAKQRVAESSDEFFGRCLESMTQDGAFQRVVVSFSQEQITEILSEVWDVLGDLRLCTNGTKTWRRTTGNCNKWGRLCEYAALCANGGDLSLASELFDCVEAHEELKKINQH